MEAGCGTALTAGAQRTGGEQEDFMKLAWTAMFVVGMVGFGLAADGGGDEKKAASPVPATIDQSDRINRLEVTVITLLFLDTVEMEIIQNIIQ